MIARPLDLASRLAPPPRSFDAVFYANVGLLALLFSLAGSAFVLAPGLGLAAPVPEAAGAAAGAAPTTATLTLLPSGQILSGEGPVGAPQLPDWLRRHAAARRPSTLLLIASRSAPTEDLLRVVGLASRSGFTNTVVAAEEPNADER